MGVFAAPWRRSGSLMEVPNAIRRFQKSKPGSFLCPALIFSTSIRATRLLFWADCESLSLLAEFLELHRDAKCHSKLIKIEAGQEHQNPLKLSKIIFKTEA